MDYALYKGDELIGIGTLEELASQHGVKRNTMYFYSMPAYQRRYTSKKLSNRRLIAIKLDQEEK